MKTKVIFSMLLVVLAGSTGWAADVIIPDSALKGAVQEALGITDGHDPTEAEMLNLTQLYANDLGIVDLTGLEYAANLFYVELKKNQISDIGRLSDLTMLRHLDLRGNQVSNINLLNWNLTSLILADNIISDIRPLQNLKSLQWLHLNGNLIDDTHLSYLTGLTSLYELHLHDNQITDVSQLSTMGNLKYLWLHRNLISDISPLSKMDPVTNLPVMDNLRSLQLGSNSRLTTLEPSAGLTLTNLEELGLTACPISNIGPLSELVNLKVLALDRVDLGGGVIDLTPLEGLINLELLWIGMGASDIGPLAKLINLRLLLVNTKVTDISPLSELTNLVHLDLRYNRLNDEAYCHYIPLIRANNPGLNPEFGGVFWYDDPDPDLVCDSDGDGVLDADDDCLDTPTDELVDESGCSIAQLCPCDDDWKNHGSYVSSVAHIAELWLEKGLLTEEEKDAVVSEAAQSDCGKKEKGGKR